MDFVMVVVVVLYEKLELDLKWWVTAMVLMLFVQSDLKWVIATESLLLLFCIVSYRCAHVHWRFKPPNISP